MSRRYTTHHASTTQTANSTDRVSSHQVILNGTQSYTRLIQPTSLNATTTGRARRETLDEFLRELADRAAQQQMNDDDRMHTEHQTINQVGETCWMLSVFNLFSNVPILYRMLHPDLRTLIDIMRVYGSEGPHILDGVITSDITKTSCPLLPPKFRAFWNQQSPRTLGKHGGHPIPFLWLMLRYSEVTVVRHQSLFFDLPPETDFKVDTQTLCASAHAPGRGYFHNDDERYDFVGEARVRWKIVHAGSEWGDTKVDDLFVWLYNECKAVGAQAGLIIATATEGTYSIGKYHRIPHAAMFTLSKDDDLLLCDWGNCVIAWHPERGLKDNFHSYFSPNYGRDFINPYALLLGFEVPHQAPHSI